VTEGVGVKVVGSRVWCPASHLVEVSLEKIIVIITGCVCVCVCVIVCVCVYIIGNCRDSVCMCVYNRKLS
jgi:hypothetical protein